ncbi:MAG: hypothetical protein ACTSUE_05210 [Promethearchaeota archaeon]
MDPLNGTKCIPVAWTYGIAIVETIAFAFYFAFKSSNPNSIFESEPFALLGPICFTFWVAYIGTLVVTNWKPFSCSYDITISLTYLSSLGIAITNALCYTYQESFQVSFRDTIHNTNNITFFVAVYWTNWITFCVSIGFTFLKSVRDANNVSDQPSNAFRIANIWPNSESFVESFPDTNHTTFVESFPDTNHTTFVESFPDTNHTTFHDTIIKSYNTFSNFQSHDVAYLNTLTTAILESFVDPNRRSIRKSITESKPSALELA